MERFRCGLRTLLLMTLIMGLSWFPVAWADLNDGLVAYYPFNGNAQDASGNWHNGTPSEGVTFTDGIVGQSASFSNQTELRITVQDTEILDTPYTFTLSAWVNPSEYRTQNSRQHSIVLKWYSSPKFGEYMFYIGSGEDAGQLGLSIANTEADFDTDSLKATPESTIPLNKWSYVAATFDNGIMKLFVNGQLVAKKQSHITHTEVSEYSQDELRIGNLFTNRWAEYGFIGSIDEVRIYNRAFTDSEIQQLYTMNSDSGDNGENKYTQADLDAAREEGQQACRTNPASCGITNDPVSCVTQSELDSAKQIARQEGKQACIDSPGSCDITISYFSDELSAAKQTAKDECQANPASCGMPVNPTRDDVIAECQEEPASCGIEIESAVDGGFIQFSLAGNGVYNPGDKVTIQLTETLNVHRFYRADLWVIIELPSGDLLYMTDLPLAPFSLNPAPFLRSLDSSDKTHQILDFEVPVGLGGDYKFYAFFNREKADFSALIKTLSSNIAKITATLRNE